MLALIIGEYNLNRSSWVSWVLIFFSALQVRSRLRLRLFFSKRINDFLAFGFLASQEVKDARVGNLGLWDRGYPGTRQN